MAKNPDCFIIMPISDTPGYQPKHFNRVYEHLISPACELAGLTPIRADDIVNTNYIALDVIKRIIESDMALCDLSSQNPNVLYELGIRQAFNKPVTLIKDRKTSRIFDIQGFRDYEYDESLRIDSVQEDVENLSKALKSTYEARDKEINSLVSLLSLAPARISEKTEISKETELVLNSISTLTKKVNELDDSFSKLNTGEVSIAYPNTNFTEPMSEVIIKQPEHVGDFFTNQELQALHKGTQVYHQRFGFGEVTDVEGNFPNKKGVIKFDTFGQKKLLLKFANLRKVV